MRAYALNSVLAWDRVSEARRDDKCRALVLFNEQQVKGYEQGWLRLDDREGGRRQYSAGWGRGERNG